MSSKAMVIFVTLFLAQALCALAAPVLNTLPTMIDLQEPSESHITEHHSEDVTTDILLHRQKRFLLLNSYQIDLYWNTYRLKASNCTESFLGQSVSEHFCSSNKVVYSPLKAPEEPFTYWLLNHTYELCSNASKNDEETILGQDFIIFKHLLEEEVTLEVFLIQVVYATQPWQRLVSHRIIPANTSGWQVFHLESQTGPVVEEQVCINFYVRVENETRLFNREKLMEIFVLDPDENLNTPFSARFIMKNQSITFPPFFKKRSTVAPEFSGCSSVTECVLQDHVVSPYDYLSVDVILPPEANLGMCVCAQKSHQHQQEGKDNGSGESRLGSELGNGVENVDLRQCVPTRFDDLYILVQLNALVAMISLPDLVIRECGTETRDGMGIGRNTIK